jgi:hypothetical protein
MAPAQEGLGDGDFGKTSHLGPNITFRITGSVTVKDVQCTNASSMLYL